MKLIDMNSLEIVVGDKAAVHLGAYAGKLGTVTKLREETVQLDVGETGEDALSVFITVEPSELALYGDDKHNAEMARLWQCKRNSYESRNEGKAPDPLAEAAATVGELETLLNA